MIWLYVLLGIVFILSAMLFLPIGIVLDYRDKLRIKIKIFGIGFKIFPLRNKGKNRNANDKKTPFDPIYDVIQKKGVLGFLKWVAKIVKIFSRMLLKILKSTIINEMNIKLTISSSDAASTAIMYGQACAALYSITGFVTSKNPPQKCLVEVIPDFLKEKSSVCFRLDIKIRIFDILSALMLFPEKYRCTI